MEEKESVIGDTSNSEIAYISVKVNNINATAMIAVSYTHLDVYKRQPVRICTHTTHHYIILLQYIYIYKRYITSWRPMWGTN